MRLIVPNEAVKVFQKFESKTSEVAFLTVFRDNFRPEVASGVISGVALDYVGVDVHVKFGDSESNPS